MVPDPEKGPLLKKAFELYATGNFNVFDICDVMYEKGLKTKYGKKIGHSRMYDTLKNRFYLGEVRWGSVHLKKGKHEPLMDEDLFNRVQEVLAMKNGHACRRRKHDWLLNGFLRCHNHQCRYTAEWHLKKTLGYYHCTKGGCGKNIEITKMEGMVEDKFKDIEFSQEFVDLVIERAKSIFYQRRKIYEDKKKTLVNQKTAFETKRTIAEEKMFNGIISDADLKRILGEIAEGLENIDSRIHKLEKERGLNVDIAQQVLNLSRDIYDSYEKASFKLKREYLGFFWEKFEVIDGLIIKSVPSPLFSELLKLEKVFYKSENRRNPLKITGSSHVIKSSQLCAR